MSLFLLAALVAAQVGGPPTYEEQARQCADAIRQTPYPIGTAGYASVYESCRTLVAEALRRDTGKLVAEGRCQDAVNLALRAGDLQLASELRAYCTAIPR